MASWRATWPRDVVERRACQLDEGGEGLGVVGLAEAAQQPAGGQVDVQLVAQVEALRQRRRCGLRGAATAAAARFADLACAFLGALGRRPPGA
jgi:hypothetical protein